MLFLCPEGAEDLLVRELVSYGAIAPKPGRAQVTYTDDPERQPHGQSAIHVALQACLHSRIASRVLLPLASFACTDAKTLYDGARAIDWPGIMDARGTLAVRCGRGEGSLRHLPYVAQVVKDAVVDSLRDAGGHRPDVERRNPDALIHVFVRRGIAELAFDLSGDSLHRRGYRAEGGAAPLKENLAAVLLMRSGWPQMAAAGRALVDPMCGTATLLIEAALMARGVPANARRVRFGADGWLGLPKPLWQQLRQEAEQADVAGRALPAPAPILGFDIDERPLEGAARSLREAGVHSDVVLRRADATAMQLDANLPAGIILTNPPYGERLVASPASLVALYDGFGRALQRHPQWQAHVLLGERDFGHALGLKASSWHTLYNGPLKCTLLHFVPSSHSRGRNAQAQPETTPPGASANATADGAADKGVGAAQPAAGVQAGDGNNATTSAQQLVVAPAVAVGDQAFANRLRKNLQHLRRFAKREEVYAYRVYDADLPEYSAAVDLYEAIDGSRWAYLQEYAPPKTIEPGRAARRLREMMLAVPQVLQLSTERLVVYSRARQRPQDTERGTAYGKRNAKPQFFWVQEAGLRFRVSLDAYVDTGLYLDQRRLRAYVREHARGQDMLNVFGYTGAVSVAAAAGHARSTTTVDKSRTFLRWAAENLQANDFGQAAHQLVLEDADSWIDAAVAQRKRYDLIYTGPPTFSASHDTARPFDILRDHAFMLQRLMQLLRPGGSLLFSSHAKRLTLDASITDAFAVQNLTQQLCPEDFRRQRPHQVWQLQHKA